MLFLNFKTIDIEKFLKIMLPQDDRIIYLT